MDGDRASRSSLGTSAHLPRPVESRARLTVRRVRLGSLARVGCSLGWLISLLPAVVVSAVSVWILRGIWATLAGWTPWTPWPAGQRIAGFALPTPEFRPREALRVEGLYQLLEPVGQHPVIATLLGTLGLTFLGGVLFALVLLLAGAAYNVFARFIGGIEVELAPRPAPPALPGSRPAARDWRDDSELQW